MDEDAAHDDEREESAACAGRLAEGVACIKSAVRTLPGTPGVYRMLADDETVLYVGKARSLKRRVVSYTQISRLPVRLKRMVAATRRMEFVYTHTEAEALLLEANLIKTLKPRYNILLRDDKSYPYIRLNSGHDYPGLFKYRGARKKDGAYFGPFATAGDVNRTLITLQKAFMLRNCTDSMFAQRKRPCLQYHIKRCTAPCVGYCSRAEYAAQVGQARDFLSGKSHDVQQELSGAMTAASAEENFEAAARYRDRIKALAAIQARQTIHLPGLRDADIVALHQEEGRCCVQVFFFRAGQNFGNRGYFPRHAPEAGAQEVLSAFLAQFYSDKPAPREVLLSLNPGEDRALLEEALGTRLSCPMRGDRRKAVEFAQANAQEALHRDIARRASDRQMLAEVAALFGLPEPPKRIEVYDNSHIGGTRQIGAMIVAGPDGFMKSEYRKFNIREAAAGDDYAMMREVMTRRFSKAGEEAGSEKWPDLLLIDGGLGQVHAVEEALTALGLKGKLPLAGVAKGPDRNAGRETFFVPGKKPFQLPEHTPVLHYLQRLRDESHRFVIGAQRTRRQGTLQASALDQIPGVGASRKRALLHRFGSAQAVARAGIENLENVNGISASLARQIYEFFHEK